MMRQDRFTEQAQEVFAASQEVVGQKRHSQGDVEHILMALVSNKGRAQRSSRACTWTFIACATASPRA